MWPATWQLSILYHNFKPGTAWESSNTLEAAGATNPAQGSIGLRLLDQSGSIYKLAKINAQTEIQSPCCIETSWGLVVIPLRPVSWPGAGGSLPSRSRFRQRSVTSKQKGCPATTNLWRLHKSPSVSAGIDSTSGDEGKKTRLLGYSFSTKLVGGPATSNAGCRRQWA